MTTSHCTLLLLALIIGFIITTINGAATKSTASKASATNGTISKGGHADVTAVEAAAPKAGAKPVTASKTSASKASGTKGQHGKAMVKQKLAADAAIFANATTSTCTPADVTAKKLDVCWTMSYKNLKTGTSEDRSTCCPQKTFCCPGDPDNADSAPKCCPVGWKCAKDGHCISPAASGTCYILGDPHYTTFDGFKMDYMGTCKMLLAKSSNASDSSAFSVYAKNEHRIYGWNPNTVSFVSYLEIVVGSTTIRINRNRTHPDDIPELWVANGAPPVNVMASGKLVSVPYSDANGFSAKYEKNVDRKFITVTSPMKVNISYDGRWDSKVSIPGDYLTQTSGMCGNFDLIAENDLLTSTGQQLPTTMNHVNAENQVGNSFVVPDIENPVASDGCQGFTPPDCDPKTTYLAQLACAPLLNTTGPFAGCGHALGDKQMLQYYETCVYDVCHVHYQSACESMRAVKRQCINIGKPLNATHIARACQFGAVGSVVGGIHYLTFDNVKIDYQGTSRILVTGTKPTSKLPYFQIFTHSDHRPPYTNVSFVQYTEIMLPLQRVQLVRNLTAVPPVDIYVSNVTATDITNSQLSTPSEVSYKPSGLNAQGFGNPVKLPYSGLNFKITAADSYVVVETAIGVQVKHNGNWWMLVRIPDEYKSEVNGIFGSYDGNPGDDLNLPNGQPAKQPNVNAQLGNGNSVPDTFFPNTNLAHETTDLVVNVVSNPLCAPMLDVNGPFKNCLALNKMNLKSPLYKATCDYDATAIGPWTVCYNLEAMAALCENYLANSSTGWRTVLKCPPGATNPTDIVPTNQSQTLSFANVTMPTACPVTFERVPPSLNCYKILPNITTWSGAQTACQGTMTGATLASVLSANDTAAITFLLKRYFSNSDMKAFGYWISGAVKDPKVACSARFSWQPTGRNSSAMSYTNWMQCSTCSCEPNCDRGPDLAVATSPLINYTWVTAIKDWKFHPICQYTVPVRK
jgi:hypothetical protein